MDRLILAGNETLDRVDEDLDLVTDIPGEPVKVSWELDRYDVMDIQGKLKEQNISEKGVLVKLNAVLTYTANEKEQASYQCVACVYPKKLSGEESTKKDVEEAIKKVILSFIPEDEYLAYINNEQKISNRDIEVIHFRQLKKMD